MKIKNNCIFALPIANDNAEVAQLVEHDLAKVGVASSSLVFRSGDESLLLNNKEVFFQKRISYYKDGVSLSNVP